MPSERREFEMTGEDLSDLLAASQAVPYLVFGGVEPMSPREKAHRVWRRLGERMGFDWKTVKPSPGGQRLFSAVPQEVVKSEKRYLGDGAYADFDGYMVVLTTEDGVRVTNRICLEPEVCQALLDYVKSLKASEGA